MTKEQECGHPKNTQHPCHLLENKQTLSDVEKIIRKYETKGIHCSNAFQMIKELQKLKEAKE